MNEGERYSERARKYAKRHVYVSVCACVGDIMHALKAILDGDSQLQPTSCPNKTFQFNLLHIIIYQELEIDFCENVLSLVILKREEISSCNPFDCFNHKILHQKLS